MQATSPTQRIRYLTTNYERLQGLRLLPSGAGTVLVGILLLWFTPPVNAAWMVIVFPLFLAGLLGRRLADDYYARTFGRIRPATPLPTGESWLLGYGGEYPAWRVAASVGSVVLVVVLELGLHVPPYVILGGWLLPWSAGVIVYLAHSHTLTTRVYWAAGAVLLAVVGIISLLPVPALASLHTENNVLRFFGLVAIPWGLVVLACSLLDHRLLVRTFRTISGGSRAGAI